MPMAGRVERLSSGEQVLPVSYALVRDERAKVIRIDPRSRPFDLDRAKSDALTAILRLLAAQRLVAPVQMNFGSHNGKGPRDTGLFVYCRLAARLAAGCFEVPLGEISAPTRGSARAARARHLAMYIAHVAFGLPLNIVGAGFARHRTTAAYACRKIEDKRDDPAFDAALSALELAARIILGLHGEETNV
jgi:hypothetical protein